MEVIKNKIFSDDDQKFLSPILYLPEHKNLLNQAIINTPKHFPHKTKYFTNLNSIYQINGHMENLSNSIKITKYLNKTFIFPDHQPIDNIYFTKEYKFIDNKSDFNYNKGLLFLHNCSWSWQHFIQDSLHYIAFCKDFLDKNNNIPIVLETSRNDFQSKEFIIKQIFNIKNPIIYLDYKTPKIYYFKELYLCEFSPNDKLFSVSPCLRRLVHNNIMNYYKNKENDNKNLIYITRKDCKVRKVKNEELLIKMLQEYCKKQKLNFIVLNTSKTHYKEVFDLFYNSNIVISPHGGANFHIYWCKKTTLFIEFGFIQQMHTVCHIAQSIGLKYYLFPIISGHNDVFFEVDIKTLNNVLNTY